MRHCRCSLGKAYPGWLQSWKTPNTKPSWCGVLYFSYDIHGIVNPFRRRLVAKLADLDWVDHIGNDSGLRHYESANSICNGADTMGPNHNGHARLCPLCHAFELTNMNGLYRTFTNGRPAAVQLSPKRTLQKACSIMNSLRSAQRN